MPLTRAARPLSASLQLRTSRSVRESAWPKQAVSSLPSAVHLPQHLEMALAPVLQQRAQASRHANSQMLPLARSLVLNTKLFAFDLAPDKVEAPVCLAFPLLPSETGERRA